MAHSPMQAATDGYESSTSAAAASKAKDLDALRTAVIDAAGVSGGLWFSYIFVIIYLSLAASAISHYDLFFERPVKMPFLNTDISLYGFFCFGPIILLVMHTYLIIHFVLLSDKVGAFDEELAAQIGDSDLRTRLRRQLPSNIFIQILAGPRHIRKGFTGFLLRSIAIITLVAAPVLLLVFMFIKSLPYHDGTIVWVNRSVIVVDILILYIYWPTIISGKITKASLNNLRYASGAMMGVAAIFLIAFVFAVATYPGERLHSVSSHIPPLIPAKGASGGWMRLSLYDMLFEGDIDYGTRKSKSLLSNRLVLPGVSAFDKSKYDSEEKINSADETASMRAKNLENAILTVADFRKVDLSSSNMRNALLLGADLRGAIFRCTVGASRNECAQLQGAKLIQAKLEETDLHAAELQGASLDGADLRGASLDTSLQGATLLSSNLQGASLRANLQGARLDGADLKGAVLDGANLRGASLVGADLRGASLKAADLRYALLDEAQLEGGVLDEADLRGAIIVGAQLKGASFKNVKIWRTIIMEDNLAGAYVKGIVREEISAASHKDTYDSFDEIPDRRHVRKIKERVDLYFDPKKSFEGELDFAEIWNKYEMRAPSTEDFSGIFADKLREVGCMQDGKPYILKSLIDRMLREDMPIARNSREMRETADFFLKEDCIGARGVSANERYMLDIIRTGAPTPSLEGGVRPIQLK